MHNILIGKITGLGNKESKEEDEAGVSCTRTDFFKYREVGMGNEITVLYYKVYKYVILYLCFIYFNFFF